LGGGGGGHADHAGDPELQGSVFHLRGIFPQGRRGEPRLFNGRRAARQHEVVNLPSRSGDMRLPLEKAAICREFYRFGGGGRDETGRIPVRSIQRALS
jgi:hypothetical protein